MWTAWDDIEQAKPKELDFFGIYQIRMVNEGGHPLTVNRIMGVDGEGLIYIGKAGPKRTLGSRIRRFVKVSQWAKARHSGGETYVLLSVNLIRLEHAYRKHRVQYRVMRVGGVGSQTGGQETLRQKIEEEESKALADYFHKYGELPPCNSSFPRKWDTFTQRLQELWGWEKT
jgi:hypothetical protein